MRTILTFGFVAVVSASAGAAAQHLRVFESPPLAVAPPLAAPLVPTVVPQSATSVRATTRVRAVVPIEDNPYALVGQTDGRLGEIAGSESGMLDRIGDTSYRRVAGPRPHIASNPYFVSDVDDGIDHKPDPSLGTMAIDQNPYAN